MHSSLYAQDSIAGRNGINARRIPIMQHNKWIAQSQGLQIPLSLSPDTAFTIARYSPRLCFATFSFIYSFYILLFYALRSFFCFVSFNLPLQHITPSPLALAPSPPHPPRHLLPHPHPPALPE
jgi:hypothetical protein